MKNKTKKRLALVCAIFCLFAGATGCGSADSSNNTVEDLESSVVEDSETSEASAAEESEVSSEETAAAEGSDDWMKMKFEMDGTSMQLPMYYDDIEATGGEIIWDDWSDFSPRESVEPGGGATTTGGIDVIYDKYDPDFHFGVSFYNGSNKEQRMDECDIVEINARIVKSESSYTKNNEKIQGTYPEIVLDGGITWGSTVEEIMAAYGEPLYNTEGADGSYRQIIYNKTGGEIHGLGRYVMTLYVYDDFGLAEINLEMM